MPPFECWAKNSLLSWPCSRNTWTFICINCKVHMDRLI